MWIARLVCSDDRCPERLEVVAGTLAEVEALACECGCAMQVLGFPVRAE
jgi:hypothetical protein